MKSEPGRAGRSGASRASEVDCRRDLTNSAICAERVHPTQKPVTLMSWCLSFIPKARHILDPPGDEREQCQDDRRSGASESWVLVYMLGGLDGRGEHSLHLPNWGFSHEQ